MNPSNILEKVKALEVIRAADLRDLAAMSMSDDERPQLVARCKLWEDLIDTLKTTIGIIADRDLALGIFDGLGIWTGADHLVYDRLNYLLSGMNGYCDPEAVKKQVRAAPMWFTKEARAWAGAPNDPPVPSESSDHATK